MQAVSVTKEAANPLVETVSKLLLFRTVKFVCRDLANGTRSGSQLLISECRVRSTV